MMKWLIIIVSIVSLVTAASKYYDGDQKPYEFGFNLKGNQHRHESKDENGIIMGEFGFLTADNVYHVTVYSTDEEGHYKIVSQKNLKLSDIGSPEEAGTTGGSKSILMSRLSDIASEQQPDEPQQNVENEKAESDVPIAPETSESDASPQPEESEADASSQPLPPNSELETPIGASSNISPPPPASAAVEENIENNQLGSGAESDAEPKSSSDLNPIEDMILNNDNLMASIMEMINSKSATDSKEPVILSMEILNSNDEPSDVDGSNKQSDIQTIDQQDPQPTIDNNNLPASQPIDTPSEAPSNENFIQTNDQVGSGINSNGGEPSIADQSNIEKSDAEPSIADQSNIEKLDGEPSIADQSNIEKSDAEPSIADQSNIEKSDGEPSIAGRSNIEKSDAEPSIAGRSNIEQSESSNSEPETNELRDILYKFNYTVGFQGHNEEGSQTGNKGGSYYEVGKDNVRRTVTYTADEKGFHPVIKFETVPADEAPQKDESDKDATLKGYEFKWYNN